MLERLTDLPNGVDGVRAAGRLSKEDYEGVLVPMLDEAQGTGRRVRLLYELGPDFEGFTPGAVWEDAKVGLRYMHVFEACAVVTDRTWIREATKLARFFVSCPVHLFHHLERAKASAWLRSLAEGGAVSHRLLRDSGVMVVEVRGPLRVEDFDALTATADSWLESHHRLRGLVIHARVFPGWENLASLLRQVRFVRDLHQKIERIAFAVDGTLAEIAPRVAEHFVRAEVKRFGYHRLDAATAWAGGPTSHRMSEMRS